MKNGIHLIEKFAILFLVLFLCKILGGYFLGDIISQNYTAKDFGSFKLGLQTLSVIDLLISNATKIILAVIVFPVAKKETLYPFAWVCLILVFGVDAVLLLFVYLIYNAIKNNPSDAETPPH